MAESEYERRGRVVAPTDGTLYRGWVIWYDAGDFDKGICYRETKWRAQGPGGVRIEPAVTRVGSMEWLKAEIDMREGPEL